MGRGGHPKPTRAGCIALALALALAVVLLIGATYGPLAIRDTLVSLNGTCFERGSAESSRILTTLFGNRDHLTGW